MHYPAPFAQMLEDLRSGEFDQGSGKLRSVNNAYCCLGIPSLRASQAGICQMFQKRSDDNWYFAENGLVVIGEGYNRTIVEEGSNRPVESNRANSGYLIDVVTQWLNLPKEMTKTSHDLYFYDGTTATYANDQERLSFKAIADKLELTYIKIKMGEIEGILNNGK